MIQILTINKNWEFFLALTSLLLCYQLWKRLHWSVGLFVAQLLLSATYLGHGIFACIAISLFSAGICAVPTSYIRYIPKVLAGIFVASLLVTVTLTKYGISGNPSMNGCLIALLLPIAVRTIPFRKRWHVPAVYLITVIAILALDASIPVGVLAVVFFSEALCRSWKKYYKFLPIGGVPFIIGYALNPSQFFSSTGRSEFWREILSWWWESEQIFTGLGTGTIELVLRQKQVTEAIKYRTVIWAHNDYLQVLADNGILGLGSLLLVVFFTTKRSMDRPWLFASVMGYAAMAFFNFPAHVPLHAFVGCCLLVLTWMGDAQSSDRV